jgi:Ca2+/Na+ antiporter
MLGGTILLFPSTICLIAVFYSARVTVAAIVASLCFGLLVALRFCAGGAMDAIGRHLLMTRPSHWAVYLLTLTVCLAVISVTVFSYRRAVRSLIEKITLQRDELERANQELRNAARNVRTLRGLIPICASCKRIRDDEGYWRQIETYVRDHSEADFSHGICPACLEKLYGEGKGGNESEGDGSTA